MFWLCHQLLVKVLFALWSEAWREPGTFSLSLLRQLANIFIRTGPLHCTPNARSRWFHKRREMQSVCNSSTSPRANVAHNTPFHTNVHINTSRTSGPAAPRTAGCVQTFTAPPMSPPVTPRSPRTPKTFEQRVRQHQAVPTAPTVLHPDFLTPLTLVPALHGAVTLLATAPRAQAAALARSPLSAAFLDHALSLAEGQGRLVTVNMAEAAHVYHGGMCQHPGAASLPAVRTRAGAPVEPPLLVLECLAALSTAAAGWGSTPTPPAVTQRLVMLYHRAAAALGEECDAAMAGKGTAEVLLSPEQCVRYQEAAAATRLPVYALRSRGLGLMLRHHLQSRQLSPGQAVRLLQAWAAGLPTGAGPRCACHPTAADWHELCACLRPERLAAGQLAAAAAAAAAFPAPAVDSMPLLEALTDETLRRAAGRMPSLSLAAAQRVLRAAVESAGVSSAHQAEALRLHIAARCAEYSCAGLHEGTKLHSPANASPAAATVAAHLPAAAVAAAALALERGPVTPQRAAEALIGAWAAEPAPVAECSPAALPAAAALASLALAAALATTGSA